MESIKELKKLFIDNYDNIRLKKPFEKKLSAKVYSKRNTDIIESDLELRNVFNALVKYFTDNVEEIYNSYLHKHFMEANLFVSADIPRIKEPVLRYFKAEYNALINLLLDYNYSDLSKMTYIDAEHLGKFKFFYNDSLTPPNSLLYEAFLKDIEKSISDGNIVGVIALSLYNNNWSKISKKIKTSVDKYKDSQKKKARARELSTSNNYYPVRSKNKQDPRVIAKKRSDVILKLFSLSYHLKSDSERAQARILQLKDPTTSLGSKRELFVDRPNDPENIKISPLKENKEDAKRLVRESVELQDNPIWYCLARREFLFNLYNPFFDERVLEDKKITIADKQKYEFEQKIKSDEKYRNELLEKMDKNLVTKLIKQ